MKRPPNLHRGPRLQPRKRLQPQGERIADSRRAKGISRWRALGREQFRALIELPPTQE